MTTEEQKKLLEENQDLKKANSMLIKSTMDMTVEACEANVKLYQKDVELDKAYTAMKVGSVVFPIMGAAAFCLGYFVVGPAIFRITHK